MNLNRSVLIAMTMPDGSVQIMNFAVVARGDVLPSGAQWLKEPGWWLRDPLPATIEEEISKVFPAGDRPVRWRRIEPGEIKEQDRVFRGAWRDTGSSVEPDLVVARVLKADMIRKERKAALEELDGQWMRATGQGKKVEADAIEAERQKWRDAPIDPRIDVAQSVEELKLIVVG